MLQTIHAEIDTNGQVHLMETVEFSRPRRALLTILDDEAAAATAPSISQPPDAAAALAFLRAHRLPPQARPTVAEIEAHIAEARGSWLPANCS